MKNLLMIWIALCSTSAVFAKPLEPSKNEIIRLEKLLGNKILSCAPKNKTKPSNEKRKGDEGFFKAQIKDSKNGKYIDIYENGGYGFGFASGYARDLHVGGEDIFLSVGDDGHQILLLEASFDPSNKYCSEGEIISYFDGFHGADEKENLKCCLIERK